MYDPKEQTLAGRINNRAPSPMKSLRVWPERPAPLKLLAINGNTRVLFKTHTNSVPLQ